MAVVYLTFDSEISLEAANEETRQFKGKIDRSDPIRTEFLLGKTELKVYHSEFVKGAHYIETGAKIKYAVKGIAKLTVKPKVAELLLAGITNWIVSKVKIIHADRPDNMIELVFSPLKVGETVSVQATLDKPAK
jgi:hypothetical protein